MLYYFARIEVAPVVRTPNPNLYVDDRLHWLSCLWLHQHVKVNLIRGLAVKARMGSAAVVKVEVPIQSCSDS